MKQTISLLAIAAIFTSLVSGQQSPLNQDEAYLYYHDTENLTNDYFDNSPLKPLPLQSIRVDGEVALEMDVDFSKLPLREVLAKETRLQNGDTVFVGAYKYLGYSLHDILSGNKLQKKNAAHFRPEVDTYIEISNAQGDKACYSWGEVFFPNNRHHILLATAVMRIVPIKSKEQWPLPDSARMVVVSDLITERNISSPTRITVKSYPKEFKVQRGLSPMFSPSFSLYYNNQERESWSVIPKEIDKKTIHTIFYGKGRGIHSTLPHDGIYLKDLLWNYLPKSTQSIQQGLFVVAGIDGYRSVLTYSEVINRNDGAEILLHYNPDNNQGGAFRIIHSGDFFSDRAVRGLSSIWYTECKVE